MVIDRIRAALLLTAALAGATGCLKRKAFDTRGRSGRPADAALAAGSADRAREIARARDALRAAAGRSARAPHRGIRQDMCSAVFITGLDPDFAAENVGYFTAPVRGAREGSASRCRSRCQGGARHAAERRDADGASTRQPGLRHAAGRKDVGQLQAGRREERTARSRKAPVADGRRAAEGSAAGRRSTRPR